MQLKSCHDLFHLCNPRRRTTHFALHEGKLLCQCQEGLPLVQKNVDRRFLLAISTISAIPLIYLCSNKAVAHAASSITSLTRMALREPDPEAAASVWDEVIRLEEQQRGDSKDIPTTDGVMGSLGRVNSRYERGNSLLKLRRFDEALQDFAVAVPQLQRSRLIQSGKMSLLPSGGGGVPVEVVALALALDGIGLALGQLGRWPEALESHTRAVGTSAAAGAYEAELPVSTAFSGLRGGAGCLGQRLELHVAMAKMGTGNPEGAAGDFRRLKLGDGQFWDARAALVVALAAPGGSEALGAAELEWAELCRPAVAPLPTSPANLLLSRVNSAAEALYASQLDKSCEDFQTGAFLPCDDAGIPGLGGSSSPCALYNKHEALTRLWPQVMVDGLDRFLSLSPEENIRNKARGAMLRE